MTDDAAREAVEHIRAAALELIAAARSLLDLTEEVVKDPGPLLAVLSAVGAAARSAGATPAGSAHGRPGAPASRVQRIRVS